MNIKKVALLFIVTALISCGEAESTLNDAISFSRDGLALIEQSNDEELEKTERERLIKDGNEKINKSKEAYKALILDSPENGLYLNNYGWVQMRSGDLKGAKKSFDLASKYKDSIHPKDSLDNNIAELNILLGKQEQ
ncbi:MAG: hypothetical protein KUG72_04205 [Pseudomonadales bacterium]|nr:hypothetical protein [Pseudomonadales bacterium]